MMAFSILQSPPTFIDVPTEPTHNGGTIEGTEGGMRHLTALAVKAAKKPGKYHDGQGLTLLIKVSGARSWFVRLQVNGKRRDFGLGSYPAVSLQEARDKASETRKQFKGGFDPVAVKRAVRAATAAILTFRDAAITTHDQHKDGWKNAKHRAQWLSTLETYAFPSIGDVRVDQVDAAMVINLLRPIWLSKPETARRVRQRIIAVLDWAHGQGFRPSEAPTRSITKGLSSQPTRSGHFAALPYKDAPALMATLREGDSFGRLALRSLILTAARSGEVRGATWDEIDLKEAVWTVPAARMKAGKEHIVPLSDAARAVLETASRARTGTPGEPLFPGLRGKALSDMTLTKVLRTAINGPATVHGFRSSFRDWAAETTDFDGSWVEAALAHTNPNKVEAAYRRTSYLEKRVPLMAAWATYLNEAVVPDVSPLPADLQLRPD